jgi:hypothetical protein
MRKRSFSQPHTKREVKNTKDIEKRMKDEEEAVE